MTLKIKNISVIGSGILGHSIALTFALKGFNVVINDISELALEEAKANIAKALNLLVINGIYQHDANKVLNNIEYDRDLISSIHNADLIIEAVPEDLELKKTIMKMVDEYSCPHAIIASNSSSLTPDEYGADVLKKDRVVGLHFFNPPYLLPIVEIIQGSNTSIETVDVLKSLFQLIEMNSVVIKKLSPGFLGNRLQFALLNEALKIVEEGIATPHDVDKVVRYGFGRRLATMGPFEVFDFGGWDTIAKVQKNISGVTSKIIQDKVNDGHYGVKKGKGFYDWSPGLIELRKNNITNLLLNITKNTVN